MGRVNKRIQEFLAESVDERGPWAGEREVCGMRTLIVDDSRFIREYLRQELERMGTECVEAEDGSLALGILRRGECFDLMLVDLNMPVMDGLECLRRLRDESLDPEMKVMMVTTEADHKVIEEALDSGADEFLMKPFTPQGLREKLMLMGIGMGIGIAA